MALTEAQWTEHCARQPRCPELPSDNSDHSAGHHVHRAPDGRYTLGLLWAKCPGTCEHLMERKLVHSLSSHLVNLKGHWGNYRTLEVQVIQQQTIGTLRKS